MNAERVRRVVLLASKQLGLAVAGLVREIDGDHLTAVLTVDDEQDRRSRLGDLRRLGAETGFPVHVVQRRAEADALVTELRPDLVVVANWYWLVPERVLDVARCGFVGIHYSLLPRYRGSAPLVWALINGDDEVGLSLFRFATGMDDGPLWAQRSVRGARGAYVGDVLPKLETAALDAVRSCWDDIVGGESEPTPQPSEGATYAAPRRPDDGLIDWEVPAERAMWFVRAQSDPYPGAFTSIEGRRLTVWRGTAVEDVWDATPGQVLGRDGDGVLVACGGRGALRLEEVELDGVGRLPAGEVVTSTRVRLGP